MENKLERMILFQESVRQHRNEKYRKEYREKGYTKGWIAERIRYENTHNQLEDAWGGHGVISHGESNRLTREILRTWSGLSEQEYMELKGLVPRITSMKTLFDNMTSKELGLQILGEEAVLALLAEQDLPPGWDLRFISKLGGGQAYKARREMEKQYTEQHGSDTSIVTPMTFFQYKRSLIGDL